MVSWGLGVGRQEGEHQQGEGGAGSEVRSAGDPGGEPGLESGVGQLEPDQPGLQQGELQSQPGSRGGEGEQRQQQLLLAVGGQTGGRVAAGDTCTASVGSKVDKRLLNLGIYPLQTARAG